MESDGYSHVHLSADAVNALLREWVDREGKLEVRFDQGRVIVRAGELTLVVERIELTESGVNVTWRLA